MARFSLTPTKWLLLIFTVALVARIVAVLLVPMPDIVNSTESGVTALNLVQGRGYTFDFYGWRPDQPLRSFMPPLFTYLLAFCLRFFNNPALAFGLIQAVLASLTVLVIYFLSVQLSSDRAVAYLSAVGVACYPVYIVMCAYPVSMIATTFLVALFVLIAVRLQRRPSLKLAVLTGIVLGLAGLMRPMLLGLLPVLWIGLWLNRAGATWRAFKAGLVALIATLTVLAPWAARNYSVQRQFVLIATNGGFTFWNGNNPFTTGSGFEVYSAPRDQFLGVAHDSRQPEIVVDQRPYPLPPDVQKQVATLNEVALDRSLYRAGLQFITTDSPRWWPLLLEKLKGFVWFRSNIGSSYAAAWARYYQILYVVLLCFAVPGLALSLRRWRQYALVYMIFLWYAAAYVAFNVQTRYRWEIEPYLIILAALSVAALLRHFRSRHGRGVRNTILG